MASTAAGGLMAAEAGVSPADPGRDVVDGVQADWVARPTSTEEAASVLRAAHRSGLTVVVRGAGTKLGWGRPPERAEVVLDLSRLDQVVDHAAGDLIVEAQAGARLAHLQEVVGQAGQRLALDEMVPGATLGGIIAANTSGPLRFSRGTARDLLIGLTIVRADGVVAKAGGRVVKNVAGYDLGKLVIGSYGTLGVVTQAVFRLHPVPSSTAWVGVDVDDPEAARLRVLEAVHSQSVASAVELEWQGGRGRVHVLLEGRSTGVDSRAAAIRQLWGSGSALVDTPPHVGRYPWDQQGTPRATALKVTFAISSLSEVLRAVEATGPPARLTGSAGTGVLYAVVPESCPVEETGRLVDALRSVCAPLGGAVVVLDAAPDVKAALDVWGPVPALALMRRVKAEFDPGRQLAPGRFVGGI